MAQPKLTTTSFTSLDGGVVMLTLNTEKDRFPYEFKAGLVGWRKRTAAEKCMQCTMYAQLRAAQLGHRERSKFFWLFHWAVLEGRMSDGKSVYSWVNGADDTKDGSGPFVVYSTIGYMKAINLISYANDESDPV